MVIPNNMVMKFYNFEEENNTKLVKCVTCRLHYSPAAWKALIKTYKPIEMRNSLDENWIRLILFWLVYIIHVYWFYADYVCTQESYKLQMFSNILPCQLYKHDIVLQVNGLFTFSYVLP